MKAIALGLLAMVSFAFGDHDFEGVIEQINPSEKTIVVNGSLIKVLPNTVIEEDSCYLAWDLSRKFVDLKVGDIVEIDAFQNAGLLTASKIEIQCVKNRAY